MLRRQLNMTCLCRCFEAAPTAPQKPSRSGSGREIYNGDLGVVRAIGAETLEVIIEFEGWAVIYTSGELEAVAEAEGA
jgi:hypothetical protein